MTIQEKINSLRKQIDIHEKQLSHLEIQKAKHGSLYLPPPIAIAIEEEKNEVQRLTKEIQGLERTPDEILPQPLPQQQTVNIAGGKNVTIIQAGRDVQAPPPCPVPAATTTTNTISIPGLSDLPGKIKIIFLANIAKTPLLWGLAGIIFGLVGLGCPLPLLPFVIPAIVIYCGYKAKLLGNTKFGNGVIFLGLVFLVIRIALLFYGVSHTETQGISPVIPTNWTELRKIRIFLFGLSYLIFVILTALCLAICFFKFFINILHMRDKEIKRWLIGVIFAGVILYLLTSDMVVGYLKKVLMDT